MPRSRLTSAPTLLLSALILALLAWYFWPASPSTPSRSPSASVTSVPAVSSTPAPSPATPAPPVTRLPPVTARSTLADDLHSPTTPSRRDLQIISDILATFRTNFPSDGNPVGLNAEITAVLTGKNKLNLSLIPADHPAINRATGELLDRYGTPYFFHAESGTRMSITSAGPDKKIHTADDETFTP